MFKDREPIVARQQAVVDLPVEAHLPDDYVPDEAQKLDLYRRLARARSPGDIAAFRQEVTDPVRPAAGPGPAAGGGGGAPPRGQSAGVTSIAREEGQLVVRFGAGLSRATAMRLLSSGALPGVACLSSNTDSTPSRRIPCLLTFFATFP